MVGIRGEPYLRIPSRIPKTMAGGDCILRKFRRAAQDVCLFASGVGAVTAINSTTGLQPAWFTLSALSTDCAAAPNLYQFGAGISHQLTDVVEATNFTNLFNEYQINKVELRVWMDNADTWVQGNGGIPNNVPSVLIAYDPNDRGIPASQDAILNRGDYQLHSLRKEFTFTYYPKCAAQAYVSAVASGYMAPASTKTQWLDTSAPSSNIEHYGCKMWFRNFPTNLSQGLCLRIQPTYFLSMRRIK